MIRNAAMLMCRGARVGYISDVHTEFRKAGRSAQHVGQHKCDVLVLAGDIGNPFSHDNGYKRFLEACAGVAKHTLVLAGNHEYYQKNRYSMAQTKTKIASLCDKVSAAEPNMGTVRFVDNEVFTYAVPDSYQKIRFICSTLWSDISRDNEMLVYNSIGDYSHILGFTPARSRDLFQQSSDFINECLTNADPHTTDIVVTHHAPTVSGVSNPCYDHSPLSSAFSSEFKYGPSVRPPYAWIFGHTHHNVARYDAGLKTILLSNQVGYPDEDCGFVCEWDPKSDE